MKRYAAESRATGREVELVAPARVFENEQVDPLTLTGGPLTLVKAAVGAGCQVAATRASDARTGGVTAVCVWIVTPDGRRARASWHGRDGRLLTHAGILDGVNVGVTALKKAITTPSE